MRWARLMAATVVAAAVCAGCGPDTAPIPEHQAPDFSLQKMDGHGTVALHDLLGRQPLIVNAWAAWCGPCNAEAPDLVNAAKASDGHVTFVGVDMTHVDKLADAKSFVHEYNIPYTILLDSDGKFMEQYQVNAFPTTFVISPSGKVVDVRQGMLDKKSLADVVQEALQSKS